MPPLARRSSLPRAGTQTAALLAVGLLLAACTGSPDTGPDASTPPPPPPAAQAAALTGTTTLVDPAAGALALSASGAFFTTAPIAVLAESGADATGGAGSGGASADAGVDSETTPQSVRAVAEAVAQATTAPVLITGADASDDDVLAELGRLGAVGVVVVRDGPADGQADSPAEGGAEEGADEAGDPADADATSSAPATLADKLADLTVVQVDASTYAGAGAGQAVDPAAVASALTDLPEVGQPQTQTGTLALADDAPGVWAAAATARAAGASVVETPGGDPRATAESVKAVHDARATAVVGLGPSFGTGDDLGWRVQTAQTGVELPGGGQLVLPGKRYVALYGSPVTPTLGVLGEQGVPETIARAKEDAAQYQALTDEPVVPTLEIIVTVASGSPGDDGNYSNEWSIDTFRPLIDAAHDAGLYVVLDFQSGRTDFLTQVKQYEELVSMPNVGVALDPEWRLEADEMPLQQIGSVGIDEVNGVISYLADLTRSKGLPQKVLILHQFRTDMIDGRERLDTSRPEVAVVIHADGQGGQGAKASTWAALHAGAPAGVYWGWKNFYDEDKPMLTPQQTYQVEPMPDFVSYQ